MSKKGIKETKELIAGLAEGAVAGKKLTIAVKKILENGIGIEDIAHINKLIEAAPDMDVINKAVEGADEALEEMKDLDQAEIIEVIGDLYAGAKRFNEA